MDKIQDINYITYVSGVPKLYKAQQILGTSTENKPNLLVDEKGSRFLCSDNGDEYIWSGSGWALVNAGSLAGTLEYSLGNLPELDTENKDTAVAAINEVFEDAKATHYNRAVVFESDFYEASATCISGMTGVALSSGTIAEVASTINNIGIVSISDSTTANGGYRFLAKAPILLGGGEKCEFVFSLGAGAARTTAAVRLGFHDAATIDATPVDGIWLDIVGDGTKATITGKSNDNTGVATTDTSLTAELSTWYRATVELSADKATATFSVRTCADGLQVWGNTLTTKLPTGAGRTTQWGIVAGETTTDAAAVILNIDYANMSIGRTLVR